MGNLGFNIATATAKGFTHQVLGQGMITDTEVTNENGHITIDTREGDDQIQVRQDGKIVSVYVNNKETISIDTSKAKSVTILGGKGQDKIEVDKKVTFPLTLKGNEHNDNIRATNPGHNDIYGGGGIDKIESKPTDHMTYGDYMRVVDGQHFHGTICIPTTQCGEIPAPLPSPQSPPPLDPTAQEIQRQWNQVLQESNNQASVTTSQQAVSCQTDKAKRLEALLRAALASGNIELAMLLMAGLETHQANAVAGHLLEKIREFQSQRNQLASDIAKEKDPAKASSLNTQVGNLGTEISLFQTFLQDVMSQKAEAQNLASNFLKSRHDTAMGIIRNIG